MKPLKHIPLLVTAALLVLSAEARADDLQALVEKGKGVATAADCMACHTAPKTGKPFAGGYGIASPLGTIYSSNITPSKSAGIGDYSEAEFARAVRQGIRKDGAHLYPAMPYDAYAGITDEDMQALYAYFMHGVAPVDDTPKERTALPFPFNMRIAMAGWNLLYAGGKPFTPDASRSAELNRGAYLADALGHCGSCHTPRGILMGQSASAYLTGGSVGAWYAPNITSDPVSGIGGWSTEELVAYFHTGHVAGKAQAAGGMAEAVQNSLQYLPDSDLKALAVYLKSVPPVRNTADTTPAQGFGAPKSDEAVIRGSYVPTEADSLRSGAELYSGYCASCHQPDGGGSDNQAYPSLIHNTATGASNPANLVAAILYGVERDANGQSVLMPGFGAQSYVTPLTDRQIADIANYVLTSYCNPNARVTQQDVTIARTGGPAPLLALLQPYILPAIVAAILTLLLLILLATFYRRGSESEGHA